MRPHHTLDRSAPTRSLVSRRSADHLAARDLARLYNRYVSAIWRGDDASAVRDWLDAHWTDQAPQEPEATPDAVSLFGGASAGTGIRWYERPRAILGYRPGSHSGCYVIARTEEPPATPSPVAPVSA